MRHNSVLGLSSLFAEEHLGLRVRLILTLVMGQKSG